MTNFNIDDILAEVFKETKVKLTHDDPIFSTIHFHQKILNICLEELKKSNKIISHEMTNEIKNKLELINQEINKLPDAIDEKTVELHKAASALHDEFQRSQGEVKGAFDEARSNATTHLSQAVLESSSKANEVLDRANDAINNINTHAENVINSILKKSLDKYENTTNYFAKHMDYSIRRAFEKSTRKFMIICGFALALSTTLQLGMWGFFIYIIKTLINQKVF